MGMFSKRSAVTAELYTTAEAKCVREHVETHFGHIDRVFSEIESPDIKADILILDPAPGREYYTLITHGMGAHKMTIPVEDEKKYFSGYVYDRAELVMLLDKDWQIGSSEEQWYWPIRLLKSIARVPVDEHSYVARGHTIDMAEPFDESTDLCAAALLSCWWKKDVPNSCVCDLPSGDKVVFYNVIPVYRSELQYKLTYGFPALMEKFKDLNPIVSHSRPNCVGGTYEYTMDNASIHLEKIRNKNLQTEEINAYNHMAAFLRCMIEKGLMSDEFMSTAYKNSSDPATSDLRALIRDEFGGVLDHRLFSEDGEAFSRYYYDNNTNSPSFLNDVELYALEYFGDDAYRDPKFKEEPYLFIPFDERYYEGVSAYIEKRYEAFTGQEYRESDEDRMLANVMIEYLEGDCKYFASMMDDDPIVSAFSYEALRGELEGFTPLIVAIEPELMQRCLLQSSPSTANDDVFRFNPDEVEESRNQFIEEAAQLEASIPEMFDALREQRDEELREIGWSLSEITGNFDLAFAGSDYNEPVEPYEFDSYWTREDSFTDYFTSPVVISRMWTANPGQVLAYVPFGPFNDCPEAPAAIAIAKHFYDQYGAKIAVITADTIEFSLKHPLTKELARKAAEELFLFCPRSFEQTGIEDATIADLAAFMIRSHVWTCPFDLDNSDDEQTGNSEDAAFVID